MKLRIVIVSTGGTIEKTYDEFRGVLQNKLSVLDVMLASLQLQGVAIERVALMNKDSLEMSKGDHALIAKTAWELASQYDGVVIVHGTDRLAETGERCVEVAKENRADGSGATVRAPIVLTGAMKPYIMRTSDALQNLTEALLAVQIVGPGVYVAMHNQLLTFPGVKKDRARGTFVRSN